ncbi:MAG: lamin tail domain-containing protein [Planctomycetota bacterium]
MRIKLALPILVLCALAAVSVASYLPAGAEQQMQTDVTLAINELMASNSSFTRDPQGQYDDWIEIYNYGPGAVDIGGMYLTDDPARPTMWRIPIGTTIPAGGYVVIWADSDTADAGLHANFKLNADGEDISLFDRDAATLINSISFPKQTTDISYGRYPDASDSWRFFPFPTPAARNNAGYSGLVAEPQFSHDHGFYDEPFSVTIASETEGAIIYYTLDGSEPYNSSAGGRTPGGTVYTGPIYISMTTPLRAKAIKPSWESSGTVTQTYIFLDDVIRQSPSGQPPGLGWPRGSVNGQTIDYGMDPDVVNDSRYRNKIKDALLALPAISLVTDLDNLFDSSTGIFVNARQQGLSWERPVSVELINPDGSEGFQIDAGLRIRGGFSRSSSNPKHAFRLLFRAEYGDAKLRFPLFEDEGVDEFDNIDLRTSQNYSWSFQGDGSNTMVREVFSRDVQREMGRPYTRSRYYHLYINGHYWGLFQTQERSEASYAESYLSGDKEDFDVVKSRGGNPNYVIEAADGNLNAWRRLWDAARAGFADDESYYRVQGMNPDGTRNPGYEKLLDVDNLIDYMICTYYVGDPDGPVSAWGRVPNNFYGIYNRNNPNGFKFFRHDAEHSLRDLQENRLFADTTIAVGGQFNQSNPLWVHMQLAANQRYQMRFADRVFKYFFNDGILTPGKSQERIRTRAGQIELAIIAESARWGDAKRSTPFTRDSHWQPEINRLLTNYMPLRTSVVLDQFKAAGWYPNVNPPSFGRQGGQVANGYRLSMSTTTGIIYYTLDGSDPHLPPVQQGTNTATTTLLTENATKRVLVPVRAISSNWTGGGVFNDSTWRFGSTSPGGVGYERGSGYENYISLDVQAQMYNGNTTCYIRIPFTVSGDPARFDFMTLKMRYDDGFVAYINGVEVQRVLFTGTPAWNSKADSNHEADGVESFSLTDHISELKQGNNILAIQGLNVSATSSDFLISAELVAAERSDSIGGSNIAPTAIQYSGSIILTNSTHVKARVLTGRTWSALNEVVFAFGPVAENLRITEIMYHPKARGNTDEPNEEFIELKNIGAESINLNLVSFTNGIDFTFPSVELVADDYVLVVQDRSTFEGRYGSNLNIAGQYSGSLNNGGERIRLEDAIGQTVLDFNYKDGWRSVTDGEGFSLTIVDPTNPDLTSWDEKDSWRASTYAAGSPGQDDSGIIPNPGDVVINEVLAHAHAEASDWIELHNTTDKTIDIGGWFLSDSKDNLFKYQIAGGTKIDPYGYIVFYEDLHFGNAAVSYESFALSENGEQVYLSSTHNGVLTGYRTVEDFGASVTGVSFGRYYKTSTDNYNFVAMETATEGSANSYPKVGPVVISEIMYNPDWPTGGSYTNDQYEYIELQNISAEPVTLYDYAMAEPWKFTDGIEFTFPADAPVTIPPGGYILVLKKPEAFSWRYPNVPADKILGPYDGSLSNAGERLELSMPGDVDGQGNRHYIRIDRVDYSDGSHPEDTAGSVDLWPIEADGYGLSLTRKVLADYANDPENWTASPPSPDQ